MVQDTRLPLTDHDDIVRFIELAEQTFRLFGHMTQQQVVEDRLSAFAVIQCAVFLSDAADQISQRARTAVPGIPWEPLRDLGDHLVHVYWDVDFEELWKILFVDLSSNLAALKELARELER